MIQTSKSNRLTETSFLDFGQKFKNNSYNAITNEIEITVWPEFLDCQISNLGNLFIWAYHIRLDNHGATPIKLINRHWKIIDENGVIQEIDGEGVIGEQPLIAAGKSFQYSSGVHLRHPSGIMTGHYEMKKMTATSLKPPFQPSRSMCRRLKML